MAKYWTDRSVYIGGKYHSATVDNPIIIELGDDVPPSRKFKPMDEKALFALEKLGVKNLKIFKLEEEEQIEKKEPEVLSSSPAKVQQSKDTQKKSIPAVKKESPI